MSNTNNSSFQLQLQEEGYGQSSTGDISKLPLPSKFGVGQWQVGKELWLCDGTTWSRSVSTTIINNVATIDPTVPGLSMLPGGKVYTALNQVISDAKISDLLAANTNDVFYLTSYFGGQSYIVAYKWNSVGLKTAHNGGTKIDPTKVFPTDWANIPSRVAWFLPNVSGTGIWEMQYTGPVNVLWFGAVGDDTTDNYHSFQAAVNSSSSTYIPINSAEHYYLAAPVFVNGFSTVFGNSSGEDMSGVNGYVRPLTCAFAAANPDAQSTSNISIVGIKFKGGSNPLDFGKCHGIKVLNCSFFNWSGYAICIYQSERGVISGNTFFLNNAAALATMAFGAKANSIHTLTGTDTSTFIDRFIISGNLLGPPSGSGSIANFLISGGKIQGTEISNNTSHGVQSESFIFYVLERSVMSGITIDGSSSATAHAAILINSLTNYCEFINIDPSGGTHVNKTYDWKFVDSCSATFINCGSINNANNTTTFGFSFGGFSSRISLINCYGSVYSGLAAIDSYRGNAQFVMVNSPMAVSNLEGSIVVANKTNTDVIGAYMGFDDTGSAICTAKYKLRHSAGGGTVVDSFIVDPASTAADGGATVRSLRNVAFVKLLSGVGTTGIYQGSGTPEGVITANMGSIYVNVLGGAGTSLYVKQTGTGNTGWIGK